MRTNKLLLHLLFPVFISLLLSSCASHSSVDQTGSSQSPISESTTPAERKLTVCLGYQPESLFLYKASTQVEWDILQAIYDMPLFNPDGTSFSTILKDIPSTENGGIQLTTVALQEGDMLVDTSGSTVALEKGVQYFPSGCHSLTCAITWDGEETVEVEQAAITYHLLDDLKWSDGAALTSQDSFFSFKIASDPLTPTDKTRVQQVTEYAATDQTILTVSLLPGLIPENPIRYFFTPLPSHAWGEFNAVELLQAPQANETPLSWGAYRIEKWDGNSIFLEKNPYYYRSNEGLPVFDELEFRFTSIQGDTNLAALDFDYAPYEIFEYNWSEDGSTQYPDQCDVVDTTVDFTDQYDMFDYLLDYYMTPAVVVNNPSNGILEGLWLNPEKDWLRDLQPILSQCIDRSYLNSKLNYGMALPTESIYSVQYDPSSNLYAPDEAARALEALGWQDEDGDPQTARVAQGVGSVEDGTLLSLSFPILNDPFYEKEAELLQLLLQDCGIQLDIQPSSAAVFYQLEDESTGSDFDVRLVTQRITSDFPCAFQTSQVGTFAFPGISADENINSLCKHSDSTVLPETSISLIPLFYHVDISIARADMCNFTPLGQPFSDLWNIEEFDYGEACSTGIED